MCSPIRKVYTITQVNVRSLKNNARLCHCLWFAPGQTVSVELQTIIVHGYQFDRHTAKYFPPIFQSEHRRSNLSICILCCHCKLILYPAKSVMVCQWKSASELLNHLRINRSTEHLSVEVSWARKEVVWGAAGWHELCVLLAHTMSVPVVRKPIKFCVDNLRLQPLEKIAGEAIQPKRKEEVTKHLHVCLVSRVE